MRFLWPLLLLVLVAGCVQLNASLPAPVPETAELLQRLEINAASFSTLDCSAAVVLKHEGHNYPSQQFLLLEKKDRVRIDALTSFGQLVMQLASNGDELSVLLNSTSPPRYLVGPATSENISRFVRIPLQVRELIGLLLYSPALINYSTGTVKSLGDDVLLVLEGDGQYQELRFNSDLQLTDVEYSVSGELVQSVSYSKFGQSGFPEQVIFEAPEEEFRVKLSLADIVLNSQIETSRFTVSRPDSIVLESL